MKCHECDKFPGRLGQICSGELLVDGKLVDSAYVTSFRARFGLPPIGQWAGEEATYPLEYKPDVTPAQAVMKTAATRPTSSGDRSPKLGKHAGTNLANLLKSFGIHVKDGCICEAWIADMNGWTIEENKSHRQEIIDHLKDRAAEENMSISQNAKVGILMLWNGVWPTVASMVDKAISAAKDAQDKATG